MLFEYLLDLKNSTNDKDFKEILKMVEEDIKFNRTSFRKLTTTGEFINICEISKCCISRCKR